MWFNQFFWDKNGVLASDELNPLSLTQLNIKNCFLGYVGKVELALFDIQVTSLKSQHFYQRHKPI